LENEEGYHIVGMRTKNLGCGNPGRKKLGELDSETGLKNDLTKRKKREDPI